MTRMGQAGAVAVLVALAAVPVTRAAGPGLAGAAGYASTGYRLRGYQLRGYQWDAVLGQRWAVFEDAAHPERPLVSELAPESGEEAIAGAGGGLPAGLPAARPAPVQVVKVAAMKVAELVVHSGDAVTLWKNEGNVRMQLAAVAEGSGGVGERVQLRVTGAGVFGNTGWRAAGVVRGPGSVEME